MAKLKITSYIYSSNGKHIKWDDLSNEDKSKYRSQMAGSFGTVVSDCVTKEASNNTNDNSVVRYLKTT